ncbi:ras-related protein Rab-33 isoform X2 [Helicoverpa zea]|uniref:ras-related protein Rab-33 isoform X2 n=1 Tax=Helicoverpa zea TaxID=7113 RepID=UPI001F59FCC6|nr:ras-related protein Rab-33 isoform X2 [Helicoverpa zea]
MRDEEPPLPPPSPGAARSAPSRLRRTLHTLRTPFRPGSPFHIGLIKRTGSSKSVASDGEIGRDERTMRKRNKKNRDAVSDASRSTDSSPGVDKKKKEGSTFMRRMGSFGKKRAGESPQPPSETQPSTSEKSEPPVEHPLSQPSEPEQPTPEPVQPTPEPVQPTPEPVQSTPEPEQPTPEPVQSTPEPVKPTPEPEQPNPEPSHASPSAERREHLYKILVIGELGTGKTSIIKRYVHQFFSQHYRATIGVDFALKVLNWDANTIIRLQLWDIAGQERFGNMTRVYYKEAVGAFIVFDVSRVATFDAVVKWKNDLDAKVQLPDGSPIPCILLANKCDQQKEGIVNSQAKMEEYCREKGFAGWFETSAKENINIEEAARSLVNKILLNDKLLQSNDNRDGDKFALDHKIANGENSRDGTTKSCSC